MDLVSELERQGKAGSYIVSNLKAIKSWLSHNGADFKRRIKGKGRRRYSHVEGRAHAFDGPAGHFVDLEGYCVARG